MARTIKERLEMARDKRDLVSAQLEEKRLQRRLNRINGKYDATDPNHSKMRRSPNIELENEEKILPPNLRNKGIAQTRDLERNYTNAKSMIRQLKINCVGSLGKLRLNTPDMELNMMVQDWFNGSYAKNCDARGDNHLSDFFKLALISTLREGDVLAVFDDFLFNDGKLWFFEADQFVNINEAEWRKQDKWVESYLDDDGKKVTQPLQQKDGVIVDRFGRVIAYAISANKRGQCTVNYDEAMIIPKGSAKHMMMPWRFNQFRGTADMLTMVADMEDNYEMRAKELQTAKAAASNAAIVKKKDGLDDALIREGLDPDEIIDSESPPAEQTAEAVIYDRLGMLTGGNMEYLDADDEIEWLKMDRPNLDAAAFHDFMLQSSGSAIGLAKAYAKLEADRSYTAFRGEMVMTWESFKDYQKWLERRLADWVAEKAIAFSAKAQGFKLPDNWSAKISWTWPQMPQVDPTKETKGKETGLKNGLTDYSEIHGPDWKKRMESLAEQKKYAEELGLNLEAFTVNSPSANDNTQAVEDEPQKTQPKANGADDGLFMVEGRLHELKNGELVPCQEL